MTYKEMIDRIHIAPTLDFGDILGNAFDLFQKTWLQGLLMIIINFISLMGFYFIFTIPIMASSFVLETSMENGSGIAYYFFIALVFILYILIFALASITNIGLQAAFFRLVRLKDRGVSQERGVTFGMFFKRKYIKKLIIFSLAHFGIFIVSYIFFVLPSLYAIIPLQFAVVIFAFHPDWKINDIFTAAFKLGNKKWGIAFALFSVSFILAYVVGLIACGIGILATISFVFLPSYLVYKKAIGFSEVEDALARIGA